MGCEQIDRPGVLALLACLRPWRARAPGVLAPLAYPVPLTVQNYGWDSDSCLGNQPRLGTLQLPPPLSSGEEPTRLQNKLRVSE